MVGAGCCCLLCGCWNLCATHPHSPAPWLHTCPPKSVFRRQTLVLPAYLPTRLPTPPQITWIGYPNSTGLRSVDYRFTDAICDPEDTRQTFTGERGMLRCAPLQGGAMWRRWPTPLLVPCWGWRVWKLPGPDPLRVVVVVLCLFHPPQACILAHHPTVQRSWPARPPGCFLRQMLCLPPSNAMLPFTLCRGAGAPVRLLPELHPRRGGSFPAL